MSDQPKITGDEIRQKIKQAKTNPAFLRERGELANEDSMKTDNLDIRNLPITEYALECLGFARTDETEDMWWRDGVTVWEFNDKGWIVDALDQAGITVYFKTIGELDSFWCGCKLTPLLRKHPKTPHHYERI
jgi:hypothetical protein